jgi:DNA-binding beta-propeller fold protein YncE
LSRIDVISHDAISVVPGIGPWGLAEGAGSVWMGHLSGEVWRIDPETAEPTAKIRVGTEVRGLGFGGGYLWVATESGLQSIDPATNEVSRKIPLMDPSPQVGPIGVAYLAGSVWISVE